MRKDWQKLTYDQQKVYKEKAEYLLERGYVQNRRVEELDKEIYTKESLTKFSV